MHSWESELLSISLQLLLGRGLRARQELKEDGGTQVSSLVTASQGFLSFLGPSPAPWAVHHSCFLHPIPGLQGSFTVHVSSPIQLQDTLGWEPCAGGLALCSLVEVDASSLEVLSP